MLKTWILGICMVVLLVTKAEAAEEISLPEDLVRAAPGAAAMVDPGEETMGLSRGLGALWERGTEELRRELLGGAGRIAAILTGVTLLGAVESLGVAPDRYLVMIGALWITAVASGDMSQLIGMGQRMVVGMSSLSKVLLPSLAMATAAAGGVTGASVRQVASVFFSDILLTLMERLLLPGIYLFIGISAADAVLEGGPMAPLGKLVKRLIGWSLCSLVGLFTGFLTLSGAVSGAADAHAVRLAQTAVAAAVPVVGRILSRASESLLAGAGLLRGMVGVCGALGVIGTCLTPVIRLLAQYLLYQGAALLSGVVGPKPLSRLLSDLGDAFGLVLALTASSGAILLISVVSSLTAVIP